MSASIFYQQLDGQRMEVSIPSNFLEQMRKAFGSGPWELNSRSLERLRGLAACNPDFDKLIKAIEELGTIKVWSES